VVVLTNQEHSLYKIVNRWGHEDSVKVEWNLGKRCNYDCSYCPSVIHDNVSPHTDIEILKSAVNRLSEIDKPIRISLTGGEPCVHPKIEELIFHIKYKSMNLSITTNGTRNGDFYLKQGRIVDQFVFSLHFEYGWEEILEKIIELSLYSNCNIMVNVMAHHNLMKECRYAVNRLEYATVPFCIRRIRWTEGDHDLFDDMKYDQNDLDWILENDSTVKPNTVIHFHRDKDGDYTEEYHANDIIKKHLNQYKGWNCLVGIESLMINHDGDVHRATCRVGGSLGNIYNNTLIIPTEPIVCDRNYCTCAADIPITKFNDSQ
jgi:hypothetical protein